MESKREFWEKIIADDAISIDAKFQIFKENFTVFDDNFFSMDDVYIENKTIILDVLHYFSKHINLFDTISLFEMEAILERMVHNIIHSGIRDPFEYVKVVEIVKIFFESNSERDVVFGSEAIFALYYYTPYQTLLGKSIIRSICLSGEDAMIKFFYEALSIKSLEMQEETIKDVMILMVARDILIALGDEIKEKKRFVSYARSEIEHSRMHLYGNESLLDWLGFDNDTFMKEIDKFCFGFDI